MPPSRRRPPKGKAATVSSRVHKITSEEQWHVMMKRAGTRLVIVQFYGSDMYISRNMRAYFVRLSVQPKFRAAIFAEVNFQEFEMFCRSLGVSQAPSYLCFYEGNVVDRYEGSIPLEVENFIGACSKRYTKSDGPLSKVFKVMAVIAALAGGALVVKKVTTSEDGEPIDLKQQILELKRRVGNAQERLRVLENANRGKQARAQRALLERLRAQCQILERQQRGIESKKAKRLGAKGNSNEPESSERQTGKVLTLEQVARLRNKKLRGDVLYSDEEDSLEVYKDTVWK